MCITCPPSLSRVIQAVRMWITSSFEDFKNDDLSAKLREFIKQVQRYATPSLTTVEPQYIGGAASSYSFIDTFFCTNWCHKIFTILRSLSFILIFLSMRFLFIS